MNKKIRSGDKVCVIAGNDKGKIGLVLHKTIDTVLVEGINIKTKHVKPQGQNKQGEIIKVERPIDISNVMLCPDGETPAKVKLNMVDAKDKEFVYESKGKKVVYRKTLKPAKVKAKSTTKSKTK
ncbi:MAG: hypothetical protein S4CHLAM7_14160 [Chlamydiae bacterium]|nr:hypothetical protein [Chlamydiota bacterium]